MKRTNEMEVIGMMDEGEMTYLEEFLLLLSAVELKYTIEKDEQCLQVRESLLRQIETCKKYSTI